MTTNLVEAKFAQWHDDLLNLPVADNSKSVPDRDSIRLAITRCLRLPIDTEQLVVYVTAENQYPAFLLHGTPYTAVKQGLRPPAIGWDREEFWMKHGDACGMAVYQSIPFCS